ncbi:hypothetical protein HUN58_05045 [Curtobacterium sp. Csp1]|uniref:hypothetical protein n=1 Tax=unclassified Curtobacterium TaxID=257496 RepID=UPI0015973A88|nr:MULTISPECIES: hypothetical protein [unclassified Curtobacterium]QKS13148.1 hypothetical protein HUN60_08345 [Curtobacterium sp. csp3]QKS19371.1 hypothetical protein HUN58_05045 [Curtobacterium sp. Csp1]
MELTRAGGTGARPGARLAGVVAVSAVVALTLAGCTADQRQVDDPSRLLQTVDTTLTPNGSVRAISDTTIAVGADGSSSTTTDHDVAKAAGDLPLRITTQYTTTKRSGTDLSDLDGYSGRVEVDLTIENLTVRSKNLTYDVAGSSRTTPALVGAPFSVAASTVLPGVAPDRIVTQGVDGGAATDGVVSTNADGDAVVQWGRLLAPPTSGASSTLHLVADVKDFSAPAFDVAAQPGLTTDLSTEGVLNGAFGSQTDSELALQRRTIDLIAQVNEVLARAGGTITEVRTNLESTSQTLGVRTAERLQESSASLASTMQSLAGELGSLNGDLGATVQTTQSTVLQQLQQTTSSLDALLGDTSGTAPAPVLDGQGCAAAPKTDAVGGSVYGNLLRVSSQLEGYAQASELCKQQVSTQLAASVGPAAPDATSCASQEDRGSLTCALWESSAAVNSSLIGLVSKGQELAARLDPDLSDKAIEQSTALNDQLQTISDELKALGSDETGAVGQALDELDALVATSDQAVRPVQESVASINGRARAARSAVGDATDGFPSGSMQAQNSALADRICQLVALKDLDQTDADALRGYLTATPCDGAPDGTTLRPGFPFSTPMDERLTAQSEAWDAIVAETDPRATTGLGAAVTSLATAVDAIAPGVQKVRTAVAQDGGSVEGSVRELQGLVRSAAGSGAVVNDQLKQVSDQQSDLQDAVRKAFKKASDDSGKQVKDLIDEQVRNVSGTAGKSQQAVEQAFDQSIAGLRTTSSEVTSDSKGTIDEQKGALEQQSSSLASAVDSQTAASLQRIDASTSASVRDVQGASTLLTGDLNRVMLDLGDRKVNGSGILGAMATSAAKSDSADYQLALASQNAAGYANVRAEDVAGILLQQQQFRSSLDAAAKLPAFRLDVPSGATATTLYAFRIGADR